MLHTDIKKFRLGIWTPSPSAPDPTDGRSLSRLFGPFNAMRKEDCRLELVTPPVAPGERFAVPTWDWLGGLDAIYLLDPCSTTAFDVIRFAKAAGCAVWVDYVDDLFNVPPSNPAFMAFVQRDRTREIVSRCIESADITTTTTLTLKSRFPHRERIAILPESCRWPQCPLPRRRVVSWRGMGSHRDDLESVLPQIGEIARMPQFSKWDWAFIGDPSYKIYEHIPKDRLVTVPAQSPFEFINTWGSIAPYLHIAPLIDDPFNRGKTPLVWLEATAVGAGVIGPDLPEWKNCGGLMRYKTPQEFGEILKREMFTFKEGDDNWHPAAVESRADVYPHKTLETVNRIRWAILNKLAGAGDRRQETGGRNGDAEVFAEEQTGVVV